MYPLHKWQSCKLSFFRFAEGDYFFPLSPPPLLPDYYALSTCPTTRGSSPSFSSMYLFLLFHQPTPLRLWDICNPLFFSETHIQMRKVRSSRTLGTWGVTLCVIITSPFLSSLAKDKPRVPPPPPSSQTDKPPVS